MRCLDYIEMLPEARIGPVACPRIDLTDLTFPQRSAGQRVGEVDLPGGM